jgi:hypothetical protein
VFYGRLCFREVEHFWIDIVSGVHVLLVQVAQKLVEKDDEARECVRATEKHQVNSYCLGVQHTPKILQRLRQQDVCNEDGSLQSFCH